MSGGTVNIETIMETTNQYYNGEHELRITGDLECFIEFNGEIVHSFKDLDGLYRWTLERQSELDDQRKQQLNQQARDQKATDPMTKLW